MTLNDFRTKELIWDKATKQIYEPLEANSGDSNGRKLEVQVLDGGVIADLTGTQLYLSWKTKNNEHKGLDAFKAVNLGEGIFEIAYTTEMLSNVGKLNASLVLVDNVGRVESNLFTITVFQSNVDDDSVQSDDSFTALTEALVAVSKFDTRISGVETSKADKTYVDGLHDSTTTELALTDQKKLNRDENESINMRMLAPDIKQALNDGEWDVSINKSDIEEGAVDFDRLSFMNKGKNLIDPTRIIEGEYASQTNGEIITMASFKRSDKILVRQGFDYVYSNTVKSYPSARYALYNKAGVFQKGSLLNSSQVINATVNGYVIVSDSPLTRVMQLEEGTVATSYEPFERNFDNEFKELLNRDKGEPNGTATLDNRGLIPIEQIPDVSDKVDNIKVEKLDFVSHGKNYIDVDKLIVGEYVDSNTGEFLENYTFFRTPHIPIQTGSYIVANSGDSYISAVYALYDSNVNYVGGGRLSDSQQIEVEEDGYIIYSDSDSSARRKVQLEKGSVATERETYYNQIDKDTKLKTNPALKIVFNGDSIPAGDSPVAVGEDGYVEKGIDDYPSVIGREMNLQVKNYAIGGSTLGSWGQDGEAPRDRTPIVERYHEMDNDADIVFISAGTNDWAYLWAPLGDMDSRDNKTLYGSLHNLCLGLIEKYPAKLIIFATPIKRRISEEIRYPDDKRGDYTLKQIADIIKEVCDYYSIPVLDFYSESMINPYIDSQLTLLIPDGVHPNKLGHSVLARRAIAYLNSVYGMRIS